MTPTTTGPRRINVSLPSPIAGRLKDHAAATGRFYLDVVIEAYLAHRDEIAELHAEATRGASVRVRPFARRLPPGRVQVALNVPIDDLAEIDRSAGEVGLDRSRYVAELLDRRLD